MKVRYCTTGFDSDCLMATIEIMPIIPYMGVVYSFMGSLSLDRYHFEFLMILKETLIFLSLLNSVLQYQRQEKITLDNISIMSIIPEVKHNLELTWEKQVPVM